jgi:hypothetical protein
MHDLEPILDAHVRAPMLAGTRARSVVRRRIRS